MKILDLARLRLAPVFQPLAELFQAKKWLWGVVLGVVVSTAVVTYTVGTKSGIITPQNLRPPSLQDAQSLPSNPEELKTLTILLLGYGGAGHSGGTLSDVIQVARIDFEAGAIALISVPRDLWVALPSGTQTKINSAFSLDLQRNDHKATTAKQMAQVVTGFPIDYYLATDFVGFQRIIGQELGGIDVKVAQTMVDEWYPIKGEELNLCDKSPEENAEANANYTGFELEKQFPCRFETIRYPAGTIHMEGDDALKYVRSRHGTPGGDFARGVRQQEVLMAIRDKLFTLEGVANIPKVFEQFAAHTRTDLDAKLAEFLWPALKGSKDYQFIRINLSTENVLTGGSAGGASIVQPKDSWEAVRQYIQSQL